MERSRLEHSKNIGQSHGYVLRVDTMQEIHANITLFLAEYGVIRAVAYGAQKNTSKLRPITRFFQQCEVLIDFRPSIPRIVECKPFEYTDEFVLSVVQLHIISIWAECICVMQRGIEGNEQTLRLLDRAYYRLISSEQSRALLIHVLFMWRLFGFMGIRPAIEVNARFFNVSQLEFEDEKSASSIAISSECAAILFACTYQHIETMKQESFSEAGYREAWKIIKKILEETLGYSLKSVLASRSVL